MQRLSTENESVILQVSSRLRSSMTDHTCLAMPQTLHHVRFTTRRSLAFRILIIVGSLFFYVPDDSSIFYES